MGTHNSIPFPQRKDLMSLDTITKEDVYFGYIRTPRPREQPVEVEGSKPLLKWKKYLSKTPRIVEPLPECQPKVRKQINRIVDLSLITDDIGKTHSHDRYMKMILAKEPRNRKEIDYKDPVIPPADPPKFIRDPMIIDDIEKSSVRKLFDRPERVIMKNDDIEGTKSKCMFYTKDPRPPPEVPEQPKKVRIRDTNPLLPEYEISQKPIGTVATKSSADDRETDKYETRKFGFVNGSTPRQKIVDKWNAPFSSLENADIFRATPQRWIGGMLEHDIKTKDVMSTIDIVGSQADTIKRTPGRKHPPDATRKVAPHVLLGCESAMAEKTPFGTNDSVVVGPLSPKKNKFRFSVKDDAKIPIKEEPKVPPPWSGGVDKGTSTSPPQTTPRPSGLSETLKVQIPKPPKGTPRPSSLRTGSKDATTTPPPFPTRPDRPQETLQSARPNIDISTPRTDLLPKAPDPSNTPRISVASGGSCCRCRKVVLKADGDGKNTPGTKTPSTRSVSHASGTPRVITPDGSVRR